MFCVVSDFVYTLVHFQANVFSLILLKNLFTTAVEEPEKFKMSTQIAVAFAEFFKQRMENSEPVENSFFRIKFPMKFPQVTLLQRQIANSTPQQFFIRVPLVSFSMVHRICELICQAQDALESN